MVLFDRGVFYLDLTNLHQCEKIVDRIFLCYYGCGSCVISINNSKYPNYSDFESGLFVSIENKSKLISQIKQLSLIQTAANLYYYGSALKRSQRELPLIADTFWKNIPNVTDNEKLSDLCKHSVELIHERERLDNREVLLMTEFELTRNDLLPLIKMIAKSCEVTKLLYLSESDIVHCVVNGYLFTLSTTSIRDGQYYQFDLDEGFYSVFESQIPKEYCACFNQWLQNGQYDQLFQTNQIDKN